MVRSSVRAGVDDTGYALAAVIPALGFVVAVLGDLGGRARQRMRGDAGVSVVEWVIIAAVVATIALGVGVILTQKLNDKANELDLTTP